MFFKCINKPLPDEMDQEVFVAACRCSKSCLCHCHCSRLFFSGSCLPVACHRMTPACLPGPACNVCRQGMCCPLFFVTLSSAFFRPSCLQIAKSSHQMSFLPFPGHACPRPRACPEAQVNRLPTTVHLPMPCLPACSPRGCQLTTAACLSPEYAWNTASPAHALSLGTGEMEPAWGRRRGQGPGGTFTGNAAAPCLSRLLFSLFSAYQFQDCPVRARHRRCPKRQNVGEAEGVVARGTPARRSPLHCHHHAGPPV